MTPCKIHELCFLTKLLHFPRLIALEYDGFRLGLALRHIAKYT
jgi:hypothetical protein